MDVETYNYNFDIVELQNAVDNLLQQVPMHRHHNQISLKHTTLDYEKNAWYEGCGSLTYKFGENFIVNGELVENDRKLSQTDFTVFNEHLKDTYIEHVYNCLSKDFAFGRFRVMGMPHKKCMSIHTDKTKRVHIPVFTHKDCRMVIEDSVYHLEANGNAYLTDTTKPHTAFNGTHDFYRIHLLADLL